MRLSLSLEVSTHKADTVIEGTYPEICVRIDDALEAMRLALLTAVEYQMFKDNGGKTS